MKEKHTTTRKTEGPMKEERQEGQNKKHKSIEKKNEKQGKRETNGRQEYEEGKRMKSGEEKNRLSLRKLKDQ